MGLLGLACHHRWSSARFGFAGAWVDFQVPTARRSIAPLPSLPASVGVDLSFGSRCPRRLRGETLGDGRAGKAGAAGAGVEARGVTGSASDT